MAVQEAWIKVWRGDAHGGEFKEYRLDVQEGMVVLDVMHALQVTQAADLAVRWNCKAGKCGSCSAEINGQPRLMCMTRMSGFRSDVPVTVAPLKAFPIIRDLVTDVSWNYRKAAAIPAFSGSDDPEKRRLYQEDVDRIKEFHNCIECFLCQNVCHVIRDHDDNKATYSGPRFLAKLASLEMNPVDRVDRLAFIKDQAGIGMCNVTKCCTEVCPERIKITDNAIIPLKERVADRYHDPIARIFGLFAAPRKDQ